jgi:hypothetical protein
VVTLAFDDDVIIAVHDLDVLITESAFKTVIAQLADRDECTVLEIGKKVGFACCMRQLR